MKEQPVNSHKNKDIPGQDKPPALIKSEELDKDQVKLIHAYEYVLPTIKIRVFSMLIDVVAITLLSLGVAEIFFLFEENVPDYLRAIMFVIIIILYEPILVSTGCTCWISLLTVTFNINRRAIHDFASGSIVIVPWK